MEENNCNLDKELEIKNLNIFFQKNNKEETLLDRYNSGTYLLDKLNKKLEAVQKMVRAYQSMRNQVQMEAVEKFKMKLKEDFVNTYYDTKKVVDIKMQEDFEKLKAIDEHSCFLVNGVEVIIKDCQICKKKCSYHSNFLKSNFNFLDNEDIGINIPIKILTEEEENEILNEVIDETELEEDLRPTLTIEYKEQ